MKVEMHYSPLSVYSETPLFSDTVETALSVLIEGSVLISEAVLYVAVGFEIKGDISSQGCPCRGVSLVLTVMHTGIATPAAIQLEIGCQHSNPL